MVVRLSDTREAFHDNNSSIKLSLDCILNVGASLSRPLTSSSQFTFTVNKPMVKTAENVKNVLRPIPCTKMTFYFVDCTIN